MELVFFFIGVLTGIAFIIVIQKMKPCQGYFRIETSNDENAADGLATIQISLISDIRQLDRKEIILRRDYSHK